MTSKRAALTVLVAILASAPACAAVTISTAATQNMSCSGGVCAPTAGKATLNVTDLENLLASGNLTVTTTGSGGVQARDIDINASVSWVSSAVLSLDAFRSIAINKSVTVEGTSGLAIATNDGGSGGTFSFGAKGNVSFLDLASALAINATTFTLVDSIASLASDITANPGGNYALANNYDASQDGVYSNSPVTTALAGTVQGLGNTISNLSIDFTKGKSSIGMFESVGPAGSIQNLRLSKISYKDTNHKFSDAGGLVAENQGYLLGDQVEGSMHVKLSAGGLVENNMSTAIVVASSANVRVAAHRLAGGLAAENFGTIRLSHADGDVSTGQTAGGLVAGNAGAIDQSFATGSVSGRAGGLVAGQDAPGTTSNSYSTGAMNNCCSGGFIGADPNTGSAVTSSYSTGVVASGDGGFTCDFAPSNANNDYWDTTTSGTTFAECGDFNFSGVTGLTTAQLQSGLPAGFDPAIWAEDPKINNGFPYLINNPPPK